MSTTEKNWWLIEAGEYVLGTLSGSGRELFEKVLERDPDAREQVRFWEEYFFTLEQLVHRRKVADAKIPDIPDRVWDNILAGIQQQSPLPGKPDRSSTKEQQQAAVGRSTAYGDDRASARTNDNIGQIKFRSSRWRWITGFSMAATLVMATLLLNQMIPGRYFPAIPLVTSKDATDGAADYDVIAVLRDESGVDLWAILAQTNGARIRSVALQSARESNENSHQLWVVLPDDAGVQSVGLLPYGNGNAKVFVLEDTEQQTRLSEGAAFAVSLEAAGGTTAPAPTGEVISIGEYIYINENDE